MTFPVNYQDILARIETIDPVSYGKTRNYINGSVTRLSPYISRGVISLPIIKEKVLKKYKRYQSEKLLQEFAWREYWQRVWEAKGDAIFSDLKKSQEDVETTEMPTVILNAETGIAAVDQSVEDLYNTGYIHNHCRMYVASIVCNIAKAKWQMPAQWMYYHLLDGDLASNHLSWQWVAGSFSSKKYYCNQENINKYCYTDQRETFLDKNYEELPLMQRPVELTSTTNLLLRTKLPETKDPVIDKLKPTLIYNAYNLDPLWYANIEANRILLLEPSHYRKYPVSEKVIDFIISLSANIPNIQIFTAEFKDLQTCAEGSNLIFKKHPAYMHYTGTAVTPDYMFPDVNGNFNSFFAYWKKCEKYIYI